jgi:2-polyprenyl-3-methyl-5-hydroxy-6-metoxy-1,4-benzoquinol methylase
MHRENIYCNADYWDSKATEHEGDAVSMWPNNHLNYYYHREQLALLQSYLPSVDGCRVLDVGCGTGRISRYLANRGAGVTGIDFSAKTIAIARRQSPGENIGYRVQSIFDLEDREAYDITLSWGSLTVACKNRADLTNAMYRLRRSLKPGGRAIFLEPIHKGFLHRVLNMNLREFCTVVTDSGFTVMRTDQLHFWPARLALAFIPWPKFPTAAVYYFGQGLMALLGKKLLGDYKAIYAEACKE